MKKPTLQTIVDRLYINANAARGDWRTPDNDFFWQSTPNNCRVLPTFEVVEDKVFRVEHYTLEYTRCAMENSCGENMYTDDEGVRRWEDGSPVYDDDGNVINPDTIEWHDGDWSLTTGDCKERVFFVLGDEDLNINSDGDWVVGRDSLLGDDEEWPS